jgi:imidazoleglycerol phosphate synthase glutamine amidotransferase subunit HisH
MIGIIHYGMGNIASVLNAFLYLGCEAMILEKPDQMDRCKKI